MAKKRADAYNAEFLPSHTTLSLSNRISRAHVFIELCDRTQHTNVDNGGGRNLELWIYYVFYA